MQGDTRWLRRLACAGLFASLVGFLLAIALRTQAARYLGGRVPFDTVFGPPDVAAAWLETQRSLIHATIVMAAALALVHWAPRRPRGSSAIALLLMTADLSLANSRLIWTVPQRDFEVPPEAARLIAEAESAEASPGPFRIHRLVGWYPAYFAAASNSDRFREWIGWARGTLEPFHGLPTGIEYSTTVSALVLDDHAALFQPRFVPLPAGMARVLSLPVGSPVVYYPRRIFDLWGARYFVLPAVPAWADLSRGYAAFLDETDLIYPSADVLHGKQFMQGGQPWGLRQDWQLRRNRVAFPRAWVVHFARIRPPDGNQAARASLLETLTFMNDPVWREPGRAVFDLRQAAIIETDEPEPLRAFSSRTPVGSAESVQVVRHEPQRVELRTSLEHPGFVILADTYYPGWQLTIDGKLAPILRANRLMRGAAVAAGEHTLVYTYRPRSFQVGAAISITALIALVIILWRFRR